MFALWSIAALAAAPPSSLGDGVLVYTYDAAWGADVSELVPTLEAYGASSVDFLGSWPALEDYRLILLWLNETDFTAHDAAVLSDWVAAGGTLVAIGENDYFEVSRQVMNRLLEDMGVESRFLSASVDPGCDHFATAVDPAHVLAAGVKDLEYAAPGSVDLGASASLIFEGVSGTPLVVEDGGVVLAADVNLFDTGCYPLAAGNHRFWENLFDGLCADNDGDGAMSLACGGDDCDNADPTVHVGAEEIPDDGIDQDCDGLDDVTCYGDDDGDGWGSSAVFYAAGGCDEPGLSGETGDCDDGDPDAYPGAAEIPDDGVDQDCNGFDTLTCYVDSDSDSYGVEPAALLEEVAACDEYFMVPLSGDCDPEDPDIYPGAEEIPGDGIDQDCDGADADRPPAEDTGLAADTGPAGGGDGGGGASDGEEVKGCGCASAPAPAAGWALLALALAVSSRRRRRRYSGQSSMLSTAPLP